MSFDFSTYWVQVWDAIYTEVKKVPDLTETTFYGEKYEPDQTMAFVIPGLVRIIPATGLTSYYDTRFEVGICTINADLKAGLQKVLELAALIHNEIIDDRTLGGIVDKTEEPQIIPNWRKFEFERAWAGVLIQCMSER